MDPEVFVKEMIFYEKVGDTFVELTDETLLKNLNEDLLSFGPLELQKTLYLGFLADLGTEEFRTTPIDIIAENNSVVLTYIENKAASGVNYVSNLFLTLAAHYKTEVENITLLSEDGRLVDKDVSFSFDDVESYAKPNYILKVQVR